MQLSEFFQKDNCVTGSKTADSHRGTKNLDFSCAADRWVYAPFDCKIVKIYHAPTDNSNTTWFQSINKVKTPKFEDYITFYVGHMWTVDFNQMGYTVGRTFKKGEKIYKEGAQGNATGVHIHISVGRGQYVVPGWAKNSYGNWAVTNNIDVWDAFYLKPGTLILKGSDAGYAYKPLWVYATTPATMVPVKSKGLQTTTVKVNVREKASTMYQTIGALPLNTLVPITEVSTNEVDGFKWVKVDYNGLVGYSALVASVSIVDILTPEEILQKQLAEANATIAKQNVMLASKEIEIKELTEDKLDLEGQVNSFTPVSTALYEKK